MKGSEEKQAYLIFLPNLSLSLRKQRTEAYEIPDWHTKF